MNFIARNVFVILTVVVALAFAVRLGDLVSKTQAEESAEPPVAATQNILPEGANEEPPPMADKAGENDAEAEKTTPSATDTPSEEAKKIQDTRGLPESPVETFSDAEVEVLQSLSKRRAELEAREKILNERETVLRASETEFENKAEELNALRVKLEALLNEQETKQNTQVEKLVRTFENMKPKEAAEILNSMGMDVLLDIMDRMNERKAAPILASMKPEIAREVTTQLAARHKLPDNAPAAESAPAPEKAPAP